jgi:hypothetical protein
MRQTPEVIDRGKFGFYVRFYTDKGTHDAFMPDKATALNCAVAPDLLEALEFIQQELLQHIDRNSENNPVMYSLNKARAAIAKAKGAV